MLGSGGEARGGGMLLVQDMEASLQYVTYFVPAATPLLFVYQLPAKNFVVHQSLLAFLCLYKMDN